VRDLHAKLVTASRQVAELEDARPRAVAADTNAYAAAIRAGKRDPGQRHTKAADDALAAARRERDALLVAADQAATELTQLIDSEHAPLASHIDQLTADASDRFAATVAQLHIDGADLTHAGALGRWLQHRHQRGGRYQPIEPVVPSLIHPNGEPHRLGSVLDALGEFVSFESRNGKDNR
jgi:hypothetical protein